MKNLALTTTLVLGLTAGVSLMAAPVKAQQDVNKTTTDPVTVLTPKETAEIKAFETKLDALQAQFKEEVEKQDLCKEYNALPQAGKDKHPRFGKIFCSTDGMVGCDGWIECN